MTPKQRGGWRLMYEDKCKGPTFDTNEQCQEFAAWVRDAKGDGMREWIDFSEQDLELFAQEWRRNR